MKGKHRISARTPGGLLFRGINYGTPLNVVAETDTQLLLHKISQTAWSGIGTRDTYPAIYMLANKLPDDWIEIVEEVEPGRYWRKCRDDLKMKMLLCKTCGGTGEVTSEQSCQACGGTGLESVSVTCTRCGGNGFIYSDKEDPIWNEPGKAMCPVCHGGGTVLAPIKLKARMK